ncbi:MAG: carbamoyltransferase [Magnetococcales bacterium]|nr:carbamoyltransferase [Magnetococcales bacterium]
MRILGISAYYHDSAAVLVKDGIITAAAQEERFSRIKHDAGFPTQAIKYCLTQEGVALTDIDHVVFYDKPFLKFERLLETYLAFAPRGFTSFRQAMLVWIKEKLFQKKMLIDSLLEIEPNYSAGEQILFTEHHQSHAASAFYPSPFDQAAVLTLDGVGEWTTTSAGFGNGNSLEITHEIHFPHSLGLLYSALTYYTGFRVNSGEYKVMGLAPYGEPKYAQLILDNLIDLKPDGSFRLDLSYFNYCIGLTMTNEKFDNLFGGEPRKPEELLTQKHMDLAASIQVVIEEAVLRLSRSLMAQNGTKNLCLAGGVALNCVANGKILRDGHVKNLWIQPAAGDAGGALGAALAVYYWHCKQPRPKKEGEVKTTNDHMRGAYLGPEFVQEDIEKRLLAQGAKFNVLDDAELFVECAKDLKAGKALGWFQGRMEFGPRALGGRSILGDPRSKEMQSVLNLKVKFRESFRPFAPSILAEDVADWFELNEASPYMLLVDGVAPNRRIKMTDEEEALFGIDKLNVPRSDIPAVTHVDYSARIQTVHKETNPKYHALISQFKKATGCPLLVNTSFNVRGEPIVGSPEDAFRCFMGTGIETLAIGNCLLRKDEQDQGLTEDYKDKFDLD